jgi:hypothetical protein
MINYKIQINYNIKIKHNTCGKIKFVITIQLQLKCNYNPYVLSSRSHFTNYIKEVSFVAISHLNTCDL